MTEPRQRIDTGLVLTREEFLLECSRRMTTAQELAADFFHEHANLRTIKRMNGVLRPLGVRASIIRRGERVGYQLEWDLITDSDGLVTV